MSGHRTPSVAKPFVAVPLFAALALGVAALPRLIGAQPYGQQAVDRQIDRDDGSLCERFGFASGGRPHDDCKEALADLRHQHEFLLLN